MSYTRFALYFLPVEGPLADFGAHWLGWDARSGGPADPPDIPGLCDVTMTPRKYGFHATLKPPFRLAPGTDAGALAEAVADMAAGLAPARCDGLRLSRLGHFLALTPRGEAAGIARVAAACVSGLDRFRAQPGAAELARRRQAGLTERQEALLTLWGYPYVMDEFRFHMTLTGRLPEAEIDRWSRIAAEHLPPLPAPFDLDEVALVGERPDGMFELVHRYALTG